MRTMRDETGGIEGMPLQLMILVIVAGLTLAIVLGWTLSIQGPAVIRSVSVDPASVGLGDVPVDKAATGSRSFTVTAYDGKNQMIRDFTVTVSGATAKTYVAHDREGTATVSGVVVTLAPGVTVGEITFTVQKAGYPSKAWTVPVVRGA